MQKMLQILVAMSLISSTQGLVVGVGLVPAPTLPLMVRSSFSLHPSSLHSDPRWKSCQKRGAHKAGITGLAALSLPFLSKSFVSYRIQRVLLGGIVPQLAFVVIFSAIIVGRHLSFFV